jgi:hypothetical protein
MFTEIHARIADGSASEREKNIAGLAKDLAKKVLLDSLMDAFQRGTDPNGTVEHEPGEVK